MFTPRHILITGASSGLGSALAEAYAGAGIRLSLHGRNLSRLETVADTAAKRGASVTIKTGDVIDARPLAAWVEECDRQQPLDLVIANAGISAGTGGHAESDLQAQSLLAVNLIGTINTVQPALSLMLKRGRGQIALVSSLAGFRGFAGAPAYCASKAAIRIYGEALRDEVAPQGIAVSVICPGFIKTPMTCVNRFPMPFIVDAERAAAIIKTGLARNRARIAFPWQMYWLVRLLAALPQDLVTWFTARLPKKE